MVEVEDSVDGEGGRCDDCCPELIGWCVVRLFFDGAIFGGGGGVRWLLVPLLARWEARGRVWGSSEVVFFEFRRMIRMMDGFRR